VRALFLFPQHLAQNRPGDPFATFSFDAKRGDERIRPPKVMMEHPGEGVGAINADAGNRPHLADGARGSAGRRGRFAFRAVNTQIGALAGQGAAEVPAPQSGGGPAMEGVREEADPERAHGRSQPPAARPIRARRARRAIGPRPVAAAS